MNVLSRTSIIPLLVLTVVLGCGPSKQELMMRSARRVRTADDDDKKEKAPPPIKAAPKESKKPEVPPPPSGRMVAKEEEADTEPEEATPSKPLVAIDELRPEKPLTEEERRKWAYDNLSAVGEAIHAYQSESKQLMPRTVNTTGGIEGFSWRVWLLPKLGYQELYDKFDFEKPWYMEPNKSLLKYIPKEYVSPERFDTMTNLQLPSMFRHMYGDKSNRSLGRIEDGLGNTVMLVEVNDDMAVEWTAPLDLEPKSVRGLLRSIGKLRNEGTFAVWGNGWPFLLSSSASEKEVKSAFTCEANDGPSARILHRPIPVEGVSDASLARAEPTEYDSSDVVVTETFIEPIEIERIAVPTSIETREAMERLKRAFGEKVSDAKTDEAKERLAKELIEIAAEANAVPADAHSLLRVAQNLATDAGDAQLMLRVLDQRVGVFAEDAYAVNLEALVKFSVSNAGRDISAIDGRTEYAGRAVHTIFAAVNADDYSRGAKLARTSYKYVSDDTDTPLRTLFGRLRSQLSAANKKFEDAKDVLARLRINPNDDEAAAAFGQFLCFYKGDWATGLPLLARSKNQDLVDVVTLDLEGARDATAQVELAELWWELSNRASGVFRQGAIDRALLWYTSAYNGLPESLEKIHVRNRIDEGNESDPTSPLALCKRLAGELDVDLRLSLTSLGTVRRQGNGRDDDDD
ncbi:MAG: DUF1559 domain-containing protein [Planctomycetota bacterium]